MRGGIHKKSFYSCRLFSVTDASTLLLRASLGAQKITAAPQEIKQNKNSTPMDALIYNQYEKKLPLEQQALLRKQREDIIANLLRPTPVTEDKPINLFTEKTTEDLMKDLNIELTILRNSSARQ